MVNSKNDLLFILFVITAFSAGLGTLSLDATGTATTIGRGQSEINMLLGVQTDNEGGNVDNLLANTDVTLTDEDTSVVDGLGKTELEDLGLETTFQEVLNLETQDVIELHTGLIEHTNTNKTTDKSITLKETTGVLLVKLQKLTSSTTNLGEGVTDTPDFTLVLETELTDELQFGINTFGFEGTLRDLGSLGVVPGSTGHD